MTEETMTAPVANYPDMRETLNKMLGWSMDGGVVKRFKRAEARKDCYGFIVTKAYGDVFIHLYGQRTFTFDGGPRPVLVPCDTIPTKNQIVYLDSAFETDKGIRANQWLVADRSKWQAVWNQIVELPTYRLVSRGTNGDAILWEGRDYYELKERFPTEGAHVEYPNLYREGDEPDEGYILQTTTDLVPTASTLWVPVPLYEDPRNLAI